MQQGDADRGRSIVERPGVGITACVVQRNTLRFVRVRCDQPTLIFVRSGSKILQAGTAEWTITSGQAVALAAGQSLDITNTTTSHGAYEAHWLVWAPDILAAFPVDPSIPALRRAQIVKPDRFFTGAIDRAMEAIGETHRLSADVARHRMTEVLLWLSDTDIRFDAAPPPKLDQKVRLLLNGKLGHDWKAVEIAAELAMSEATLRRHLAAVGTSFGDILVDARMAMAMQLLQSTNQPISHIAYNVGYASASRFAMRFRDRFGFAPTAIRGHKRATARLP